MRLRAENARLLKLLKLTLGSRLLPRPAPRAGRLLRGPSGLASQVAEGDKGQQCLRCSCSRRTDFMSGSTTSGPGSPAGVRQAVAGKGVRREDRSYLPLTSAVLACT